MLSGLPATFPLFMWDKLLEQLDMQVNLLRFSNVAPNVCAWTVLRGTHDFNRHPLAPLGIEMHMLEPADKRKSWGVKSKKGHYLGTSLEHYRYFFGWFADTGANQGSESVVFKHKYITTPTVTPSDAIVQAARQLAAALKGNIPPPLVKSGIDHIKELTTIFDRTQCAYDERDETTDEPDGTPPPRVVSPDQTAEVEGPLGLITAEDSNSDTEDEDKDDAAGEGSASPEPQLIVASNLKSSKHTIL